MLDASNRVVPGVRPGTLAQAAALVGRGSVVTYFGRLRHGIVAVDIDMARSAGPRMALSAWCAERGLWHLARDSGRSGHVHVFVVVGALRAELEDFVAGLCLAEKVARTRIDVREAVRPLSAPHRSGATAPLPRLARAARRLPRALRALPDTEARRTPRGGQARLVVEPGVRHSRGLPRAWAAYLLHGACPPQVGQWSDRSRSAVEATATFHMVRCGWSEDQAWLAITTSHPHAMSKARSRGRRWWTTHVWKRAVADVAGSAPVPTIAGNDDDPGARGNPDGAPATTAPAVRAWQAAFLCAWGRYGRDRRHTLRFLVDTIAQRMIRTGSTTVPCPERDLVLDTGITSRAVIRACLHQLHDDGWLVLETTFDPQDPGPRARSHHVSLPATLPETGILRLSCPPSSFTPLPALLRSHLGPALSNTWASLPPVATPLGDLAGAWGPTLGSASTVAARLRALADMGLAECDELGRWRRTPASGVSAAVLERARQALRVRSAAVGRERADYALVRSGRARWEREREAVLQRWRARRELAARQWWDGLDPQQRRERTKAFGYRFAHLSLLEQGRLKEELARRRAAAGVISEDAVRRAWIAALPPEDFTERVIERTMSFHSQPAPLRAARAAAWAAHRARWGITRDGPLLPSALPSQGSLADAQRWEQLDLLALGDALDRDPQGRWAGLGASGHTSARSQQAGA